jgi:hypothetical protein
VFVVSIALSLYSVEKWFVARASNSPSAFSFVLRVTTGRANVEPQTGDYMGTR